MCVKEYEAKFPLQHHYVVSLLHNSSLREALGKGFSPASLD